MATPFLNIYRGNMPAHASGGGGGFGGGGGGTTYYNIFNYVNCSYTHASHQATDPSGYAPSVGDVIEVTPSGGSAICATVQSTGQVTTDPQTTITGTFTSCGNCNATNFCHVPSDFSMSLSGGSYDAIGYNNAVQVAAAGLLSAVNIQTQLTLETKLGGRAASDIVLSSFGQATGLSTASGNIRFNFDGSSCFNSATENFEYRLKVECGDNSTGSWATHSTSYTSWSSLSVNHASAGKQCTSGGSNFVVTDCNSGATAIIDDSGGYSVSVGDFVDWYDNSGNGPFCGELTASSSSTATGSAYGGTYTDCLACNSANYLQIHQVTDCSDSSTHLVQDQSGYSLSVGDFVDFYDSSSTQRCGTVTALNQTGNANGAYFNGSGYSTCVNCYQSSGVPNPTLYTATDCNNSSATYILADDTYSVFPSTGDVVLVYLNAGDYACVSITGTTSSGTSAGYLESSETDCATCSSNNSLTLYTVQECGSDTLEVIEDAANLSLSAGDVVSYYRNSSGTTHCGTIGGTTTNGPAAGETSAGYQDCAECISYEGL